MMTPCILASKVNSLGRATRKAEKYRDVWIAANGPVPDGMDIGHLCHDEDKSCAGGNSCLHRGCYNLEHLAPQTRQENLNAGRVYSAETNAQRSATQIAAWSSQADEVLIAHADAGRQNAAKGYAIPGALDELICDACFKPYKGIRGLNAHKTKTHGGWK